MYPVISDRTSTTIGAILIIVITTMITLIIVKNNSTPNHKAVVDSLYAPKEGDTFYYFKKDNTCYLAHNWPGERSFAFSQTETSHCNGSGIKGE